MAFPKRKPGAFLKRVRVAVERQELPAPTDEPCTLPPTFWPALPSVEGLLRREAREGATEAEIREVAVAIHHAMAGLHDLVQIAARPPLRARLMREDDGEWRWRLVRDEARKNRSFAAQVASIRSAAQRGDQVWQRRLAEVGPVLLGLLIRAAGGIDQWAHLVRAAHVRPIPTLPPAPSRDSVLALLDELPTRGGGRPEAWQRDAALVVAVAGWARVTGLAPSEKSNDLLTFLADLAQVFGLEGQVSAATGGDRTFRKILAGAKIEGF